MPRLFDSIGVLNNIFGEHATNILLASIEKQFKIFPDQLPDRMEDFQKSLEQIYGRETASSIIDRISMKFILNELQTRIRFRYY
jgi:hypothetical protein